MIIQGTNSNTKLRHALRSARALYLDNVRNGLCKLDKKVLARVDAQLEKLDVKGKSISRQH